MCWSTRGHGSRANPVMCTDLTKNVDKDTTLNEAMEARVQHRGKDIESCVEIDTGCVALWCLWLAVMLRGQFAKC